MNHRGRFQAQGVKLEESETWAKNIALLHSEGVSLLDKLKSKLGKKDLKLRERGFSQCRNCIDNALKNNGIRVEDARKPFIKSFPKNYKERVDLEVHKGIAFVEKNEEE